VIEIRSKAGLTLQLPPDARLTVELVEDYSFCGCSSGLDRTILHCFLLSLLINHTMNPIQQEQQAQIQTMRRLKEAAQQPGYDPDAPTKFDFVIQDRYGKRKEG